MDNKSNRKTYQTEKGTVLAIKLRNDEIFYYLNGNRISEKKAKKLIPK